MKSSQYEAKTFGLGELISQRKLFKVPSHQRSYSWSKDSVRSFLDDIGDSFESKEKEYFVGLIVIQGPEDGEWILLDGQQRLTTVAMIYAAIRDWLAEHGHDEDAAQIGSEFLTVRRLGGEVHPRMVLNEENRDVYKHLVIGGASAKALRSARSDYQARSSNRLMIEASLACRDWVSSIAVGQDSVSSAARLFNLSSFLETHLKAVCVEVSSDVDAYILFESLNDRGVELTALDLLKNYIFSQLDENMRTGFESRWQSIVDLLEDSNPDDFLKVFWTARHGVVQKNQLFKKIKERYSGDIECNQLIEDLLGDARLLRAISDHKDVFWSDNYSALSEPVSHLNVLGSRQARAVILSCLLKLSEGEIRTIIEHIIVSVVRYQIVGRGRTGVVEKVFGRVCQKIFSGRATQASDLYDDFRELYLSDDEFENDFAHHAESKLKRNYYFLWRLDDDLSSSMSLSEVLASYSLSRVYPKSRFGPDARHAQQIDEIGNFCLVRRGDQSYLGVYGGNRISPIEFSSDQEVLSFLEARSASMALAAKRTWSFSALEEFGNV